MALSVLTTKIRAPSYRPETVGRPRLIDKLNSGLRRKLTLLSAPAGFGKTSLLAQWISQCGRPAAWISLEEGDGDLSRFWTYFVAALRTIKPDVGASAIACLESPLPQPIEAFLVALINDIAETMPPFVAVLDDYHAVVSPQLQDSVSYLLDHLPLGLHLVVSTRVDPPLALARLRARGELSEIRISDLRFTPAESQAFLNDAMKLDLSEADVRSLWGRTEGWVASLQMAGISMQGRHDPSAFVRGFSGSHRYVLDYLTDEVLSGQTEDIRSFLMRTSILRRMTGSLCDAVTGRDDGHRMLAYLDNSNLFVVPLDDDRKWYRYHQLFDDLLRTQLAATHPELGDELHARASLWYEGQGSMEDAIFHAMAAKDYERAATLAEKVAASLLERSQISTLLSWAAEIGQEAVLERPWLCVCMAWASVLGGQPNKADAYLQAGSAGLARQPAAFGPEYSARVRGHLLTIGAYGSRARGDVARSIELGAEADRWLPASDTTARSANTLNLGIACFMKGDIAEAAGHFEEAASVAAMGSNFYVGLESTSSLADLQVEGGRLHEAASTYERALDLGRQWGGDHPLPAISHAYYGLGRLHYEWNNLEEAARRVMLSIELSEAARLPMAHRYASLSLIKQASGDSQAALDAMNRAEDAVAQGTLDALHISAWKGRLLLAQGSREALQRWHASMASSMDTASVPEYWLEMPYLVATEALLALGRASDIPERLDLLREKATKQGRRRSVLEIAILQALALNSMGKKDEALIAIETALAIAAPEGFVRTFVDRGPAMRQLLRQAARSENTKDYVQLLLTASSPVAGREETAVSSSGTGYYEQLNEREKAILRFIASGASNQKIAEQLFISVNTVKWHTRHIFEKLGVNRRAEAVSHARDLNLI